MPSVWEGAKRAIEHLVAANGDLETEGQITYEDGMISCSALQLGEMALRSKNAKDRQRYTEAMLKLLDGHDCLTQLRIPAARRRRHTDGAHGEHMPHIMPIYLPAKNGGCAKLSMPHPHSPL